MYKEIEMHMKNKFLSKEKIKSLETITDEALNTIEDNIIYRIKIIALAVDIVKSKKISSKYGEEQWSKIISEFIYGITKIIKAYQGKWIMIQGDAIKCIFDTNSAKNIDEVIECATCINTFIIHLNKKIELMKSVYPCHHKIKVGIGLWFSFNNYATNVGIKKDRDIVFIGQSVNYASQLSDMANRKGREPILFNDELKNNFSHEKKIQKNKFIKQSVGDLNKLESIWGCDFKEEKYLNFIKNNIKK